MRRILLRYSGVRKSWKFWVTVAACLALGQVLASLCLPKGIALTTASDVLCALMMLALLLMFADNAVASRGHVRAFWILQASSCLMWLADQGSWFFYDVILRKPMPDVFTGDILFFLAGVPMLAGLLLRPHLQLSERSARLGMIDFSLLMLWWIYFYIYFVLSWQYVSLNLSLYDRNYDHLYNAQLMVLMAASLALRKGSSGAWRRFYGYYLLAVLLNSTTLISLNKAIEEGKYYGGSWYDTPYLVSFVFFMLVAIKGRGLMPLPEKEEEEKRSSRIAGLTMVAVMSLPVIAVATVLDRGLPFNVLRFRVIVTVVTMFAMAALVFMKQHRLHVQLKQSNRVLQDASMTDPLTGVRNRRFFSATIRADVAQTLRAYADGHEPAKRDLVFYLVDVDNFKEVNDQYGHDAGDRMLVEIAQRISSAIRNSDVLVRWGGEEFLIVSRYTNRRESEVLAQRVVESVGETPYAVRPGGEAIRRTCSVGWAAFPWLEEDVEALDYEGVLIMADRGLQRAKAEGRNRAIGMVPPRTGVTRVVSGSIDARRLPVETMAVVGRAGRATSASK